MKEKKYQVTLRITNQGRILVNAKNEEQAAEKAQDEVAENGEENVHVFNRDIDPIRVDEIDE